MIEVDVEESKVVFLNLLDEPLISPSQRGGGGGAERERERRGLGSGSTLSSSPSSFDIRDVIADGSGNDFYRQEERQQSRRIKRCLLMLLLLLSLVLTLIFLFAYWQNSKNASNDDVDPSTTFSPTITSSPSMSPVPTTTTTTTAASILPNGDDDNDGDDDSSSNSASNPGTLLTRYDILYTLLYENNAILEGRYNDTCVVNALQFLAYHDLTMLHFESIPITTVIERFAIVVFYYATTNGGAEKWYKQLRWMWNDTHICNWYSRQFGVGVYCDVETHSTVESLYIIENSLAGTIPPEISLLSNLKVLDLRKYCSFVFHCSLLMCSQKPNVSHSSSVVVDLLHVVSEDNSIGGSIPSELGLLGPTLQELNLSYNKLNLSNIPKELSHLNNLNALFLQGNVNFTTTTRGETEDGSTTASTSTLDDVFCNETSYGNAITEFVSDCNASKGRGNVPCVCCTLCCDEHDNCGSGGNSDRTMDGKTY